MKLRTLLLVTYYFPPSAASGSFRLLGFAQHLQAQGWRTVVVAPPQTPHEPVDEALGRKVPPETTVYSVPYPRGNRLTRRFLPFGIWVPPALAACRRAIGAERPDAILTSSPPHQIHLVGRWLKARYGLPWVIDYRDPWIHGLGTPPAMTWTAGWERFKERRVLKSADAIVVNTPLARDALMRDVPDYAAKITAITNGFDPENFVMDEAPMPNCSVLSILHTGEIYGGRDPRPLFDALQGLQLPAKAKPLRVTFLGTTSDPRFGGPDELCRRGLQDVVQFAGHVKYSEALRSMQAADILLLLDNPGRRVGIPAKLFEYFGARRPILALTNPQGDTAWALRQSGVRHRIAVPDDPVQIRQALTELIQEVTNLGNTDRQPIPEQFTRAHMAAQMARVLDQVAR